jgi:hypothetical protein
MEEAAQEEVIVVAVVQAVPPVVDTDVKMIS